MTPWLGLVFWMGLPLRAAKAFSFDEVIGDFDEELRSMNSPEKKSRWLMVGKIAIA